MMPIGQYIPGDSVIHRMNATSKLICLIVFLSAIVLTDSILGYALIIAVSVIIVLVSGIGFKTAIGSIGHMWLFFIIIFLMNTLFFETQSTLLTWWILNISIAGITQGANVVLRVMLLMVFSNILFSTTPPIEITNAIETLILPLKLLRVPTEEVAMIISVAIQFIPTFIEETDMIRKAQTARGAKFESRRLLDKAESIVPLVVPIFLSAFRRADELSQAMEARGYRRAKGRTKRRKAAFRLADMAALAASCAICAVQIYIF